MNILTKASLLLHILRWRLSWYSQNTRYTYSVPGNPKFMGPRDAVKSCIRDGDVVSFSGLAGTSRPIIMYYTLRDLFKETGHPRDLDLVVVGGLGGRGRIPGTLEELAIPGLVRRLIAGHMETHKALLRLGDQDHLELQTLPQGQLAALVAAQARGEPPTPTRTGVGTFMDPRVGRGSRMNRMDAEQLVTVVGDCLRYDIPKIQVAVLNAPAADRQGNIFIKHSAMIAESLEIAQAAKRNGGKVIVNVGHVVEKGEGDVFLRADQVDAIVPWRLTEQGAGIPYFRYWPLLTPECDLPIEEALPRVRYVNRILGITPRRTPAEDALARMAATLFADHAHKGCLVNIGVGLPEEVCRLIYEGGLMNEVNFFTESGVIGGVPAPGIFFGSAVCPTRLISSPEVFKMAYEKLDIAILGALQVDSLGNVNVSKRGEGMINFVGPGGFIDLTVAAKMILFVSSWMDRADISLEGGKVSIRKPGKAKFLDKVNEITFNGQEALKTGRQIFYATNVGAFQLTARGMELIRVMPGVDIERDILKGSPMKVVLPSSGQVPVVDTSIVTGEGFRLQLAK